MTPAERALAILTATAGRQAGFSMRRGSQRLVFDQLPTPVRNKAGEVVGVEVMVRLFQGATEVHIDPHRVILNPPTVPRVNLTFEEGALDAEGRFVGSGRIVAQKAATEGLAHRRIVGAPDPEAALLEAIGDSVDLTPNAPGWRTRGTVTTVFATAPGGNGTVQALNQATYADARNGTSTAAANNHLVGQALSGGLYSCFESFLAFDTSGVPDTDTISGTVASLDGSSNSSTQDFIAAIAAAANYNGGAVVTGDWEAGASLPTSTATWNSSGYSANYNAFSEVSALLSAVINKTGSTFLIVFAQPQRDNTAPLASQFVTFTDADAAGTGSDPKLDITHAGSTVLQDIIGGTGIIPFAR